jgi:uncharacterized protein (DUF58 family)
MLMKNQLISEIRKKIKYLTLITKKSMRSLLVGENKSKTLGQGLSFDQTREYQHGDDVRHLDWKAYARTHILSTKQYTEEKKKKIFILCDISYSSVVDTALHSKLDIAKQATSIIMLASALNNDYVGTILYDENVVSTYLPTNKINTVFTVLESLFLMKQKKKSTTNIKSAVEKLLKIQQKNSALVVVISDFIDEKVNESLLLLSKYYDIFALRTLDPIEIQIPNIGYLRLTDIETGKHFTINTSNKESMKFLLKKRIEEQNKIFKQHGISFTDLFSNDQNIVDTIIKFLIKTEKYR